MLCRFICTDCSKGTFRTHSRRVNGVSLFFFFFSTIDLSFRWSIERLRVSPSALRSTGFNKRRFESDQMGDKNRWNASRGKICASIWIDNRRETIGARRSKFVMRDVKCGRDSFGTACRRRDRFLRERNRRWRAHECACENELVISGSARITRKQHQVNSMKIKAAIVSERPMCRSLLAYRPSSLLPYLSDICSKLKIATKRIAVIRAFDLHEFYI